MALSLFNPLATFAHIGIHKAIGPSIICLTDIAKSGNRREGNKIIQIKIATTAIKIDHTGHFGRQHIAHLLNRFIDNKAIAAHPCTVENAGQLAMGRLDGVHQLVNPVFIGDINTVIFNRQFTTAEIF